MSMTARLSPQEIDRIASEWAARRCSGLTLAEQQLLDCWLKDDPRHLGAYAKAEAVLAQLDRIGAAGPDALRICDAAPPIEPSLNRRTALVGGMAAALTISAGGAFWLWRFLKQESYSTRIGETKEIALSDGSLVTLNTDSRLLVHYSKTRRQIQLLQGEALFDVAKNKNRPFVVTAGDTQVRAVGTSFTVKLLPSQPVQVLVREGVVEINRPQVPQVAPVQLPANMLAVAPSEAPISTEAVPLIQVTRDLAWREGRIAFDNETLANAAREFERYSDVHIRVPIELENQTVTGLFVSNDPVGFARAAAISLNLQVEVANREVRLSR
jgi:transmembrane sensor